ncbi:AMP-binding protein [Sphaerisporangium sp. NPDC051017]|uniref:AMP-binding protein n=1 Tax=Sphaerisporangium sp. NPDC051017 TaxID=3154636 RepID=UPI003432BB4A
MPSSSFVAAFARRTRERPDAPALSWGERVVGYGELAGMSERAYAALDAAGVPEGAPVCVPARKSPETIALLIACVRAGRRVLLPSEGLGPMALAELCVRVGCTHVLEAGGDDPLAFRATARAASELGGGSDPAAPAGSPATGALSEPGLLLTTSGSTGLPKIVVLSAGGVDRFMEWAAGRFGIGPGARVLNYAPLNFDLCLLDVWASLSAGACVELVDPGRAADGSYLAGLCAEREPDVIQAVPMFFRLATEAASRAGRVFPGVREVMFTGDVMPLALLERTAATFPNARMWNIYGCTETNDSFLHEVTLEEARELGVVPIGRPIEGVHATIVDESGQVVTGAGAGELVVATPFQSRGYSEPRLDRERWRDGHFRTGDLVRRDERGLVFLTGRNDHQVKVRGVRTNLQEVERVVLAHPEVLEAAVVAVPDEAAGNVLHAVVRRRPGSGMNGLRLRVHCAAGLPRTAIPGVIEIVDQALPRTSTGKIDRTSVRRRRMAFTPVTA